MLYAYCDESYSSDVKTTPFYVVAGFLGEAEQWRLFDELWRDDMRALRIEAVGCHAAKCANGAKPYDLLTPKARWEIQYRLIVDIAAAALFGVVAAIDMHAYRTVRQVLSSCLSPQDRQYNEPHVLAVRQCAQQMCQVSAAVTDEPISFTVDRNVAFGRRAKAWYGVSVSNEGNEYRHRFGPFEEADRMFEPGLQAADMLAYAAFRHIAGREGWQWRDLRSAVKINVLTTDDSFWRTLASRFEAARDGDWREVPLLE